MRENIVFDAYLYVFYATNCANQVEGNILFENCVVARLRSS